MTGRHPELRVRLPWPRRWFHVHVYYDVSERGPLDRETLEPLRGAGPCANLVRCRCGDTLVQHGWVTIA